MFLPSREDVSALRSCRTPNHVRCVKTAVHKEGDTRPREKWPTNHSPSVPGRHLPSLSPCSQHLPNLGAIQPRDAVTPCQLPSRAFHWRVKLKHDKSMPSSLHAYSARYGSAYPGAWGGRNTPEYEWAYLGTGRGMLCSPNQGPCRWAERAIKGLGVRIGKVTAVPLWWEFRVLAGRFLGELKQQGRRSRFLPQEILLELLGDALTRPRWFGGETFHLNCSLLATHAHAPFAAPLGQSFLRIISNPACPKHQSIIGPKKVLSPPCPPSAHGSTPSWQSGPQHKHPRSPSRRTSCSHLPRTARRNPR